ncbi:MAG: hypothetical protein H6815_07615 [Phycisphaeraceae bacterium]|nr:hypothetical protein [Phycisphaerales bacterium]MCB9860309.1 hypothetical protein [Phycisphaeraceae bacterium]
MNKRASIVGLLLPAAAALAQPITITQSTIPDLVNVGSSVACATDPAVTPQQTDENGFIRSFDLTQFLTAGNDLQITSIDFGVEAAVHPDTFQTVTVNLFVDPAPASPIVYTGLQLVSSYTVLVFDSQEVIVNAPLTTPVQVCGKSTLVVEVTTPDYTTLFPTENALFFIGSNPFGQTAPSFIRAPGCGAANPTDLASLSFPNMHICMSVNGNQVASTMCTAGPCYADCDTSGTLNIFDYICYGNEYASGTSYADCDGSGSLNIFDYICYGNEYAAGCP